MSTNNNANESSAAPKKKGPRKMNPLPKGMEDITEKDSLCFVLSLECDANPKSESVGQEFLVAQGYNSVDDDGNPVTVDLKVLSLDQLRFICRKVGISHVASLNKFACRKQIAVWCKYQLKLRDSGLSASSYTSRITSNICRAINVVFSSEFVDEFNKVNDRKGRIDHETSTTNKGFWLRATEAYNCCGSELDIEKSDSDDSLASSGKSSNEDEFTKFVFPADDVYLAALQDNPDINLSNVDPFTPDAFKKKIHTLFKVRRLMKKNMTQSGTHDNDPYNFVEIAMREFTGLTPIGVYYFYCRCEANKGIDDAFQPFLDNSLKGSSVDLGDDLSSVGGSAKKKANGTANPDIAGMHQQLMQEMTQNNKRMMESMDEQVRESKRSNDVRQQKCDEMKRYNNFMQRLELAKAMNDNEAMKKLLEESNSTK
jgi:hypothetical protein